MQSSQRSTSDANRPSSSLVFTSSAPAWYVWVSRAKKRRTTWLGSARMRWFMRWRNSVNSASRSFSSCPFMIVLPVKTTAFLGVAGPASDGPAIPRRAFTVAGGSAALAQQLIQLAGAMQRHHVVVAADMHITNEDLRHAGATGERHHLLALGRIQVDAYLGPSLALALQEVLGGHAVRAHG